MKRTMALLLALLMALALGCPTAIAEDVVEIEFWHSIEEQAREPILALLDQFMAQNPNIKVTPVYQGAYAASNEALLAAVAAGGSALPGVHQTLCTVVSTYAENGVLENLTPYIADSGFPIEEYAQGMVGAYSYADSVYGIPSFCSVCPTIYYNKTIAKEEGIELPKTWAEWDAFVRKAAVKDEAGNTIRYAATFAGWGVAYYGPIFWANGVVPFADEEKTQCALGSEEAMAVYKMLKSWSDEGLIKWGYGTNASTNMRQSFIDGNSFAVFHTSAMYSLYAPAFAGSGTDLGVAFPPAGTTSVAELGGSGLTIPAKLAPEKKEAAWKLIEFLSSADANMTIVKATGYLPTSTMALASDACKDYVAENPELQNLYDHLDEVVSGVIHPCWTNICTLWQDAMAKVFNEGADLEETIGQMVEDANELLEDF